MSHGQGPASDRTPPSGTGAQQSIRAAHKSGDWDRVLDEVEATHASAEMAAADPAEPFDAMIATLTTAAPPDLADIALHAPSSARTPVGLFPQTERAIRTLDPRQPSIETTRLDLFTSPPLVTPPEPGAPHSVRTEPRSYRTRVGLYFVPREPATEPTLPELNDDTSVSNAAAPFRSEERFARPLERVAAWMRRWFTRRD